MLEIIAEFILDVFLQVFFEVVVESLWPRHRRAWKPARLSQAFVLLLFGGIAGLAGYCLFPQPIFVRPSIPGISLIISPLVAGLAMHCFGRWRERRGQQHSFVATFWGGAIFAFAMSATRLFLVNRA